MRVAHFFWRDKDSSYDFGFGAGSIKADVLGLYSI